jgi:hypothetical protein
VIDEIQYWGHGKWGRVMIGDDVLDGDAIASRHRPAVDAIRACLAPDALVWLRTCETFGAYAGHDFAQRLGDAFGARVAGHTHVIGWYQSGLHGLAPGMRPHWPADEGLADGTPAAPIAARASSRRAPHTITCLAGAVPPAWFGPDDRATVSA